MCACVRVCRKKCNRGVTDRCCGTGWWLHSLSCTRGHRGVWWQSGLGAQIGKTNWLVVSLTCDLARSSKCRRTCFASRSGQLSQGYNWRIWPTPREQTIEQNITVTQYVLSLFIKRWGGEGTRIFAFMKSDFRELRSC